MLEKLFFLMFIMFISASAYSWDGVVRGKITVIEITAGTNFGFRIHL